MKGCLEIPLIAFYTCSVGSLQANPYGTSSPHGCCSHHLGYLKNFVSSEMTSYVTSAVLESEITVLSRFLLLSITTATTIAVITRAKTTSTAVKMGEVYLLSVVFCVRAPGMLPMSR